MNNVYINYGEEFKGIIDNFVEEITEVINGIDTKLGEEYQEKLNNYNNKIYEYEEALKELQEEEEELIKSKEILIQEHKENESKLNFKRCDTLMNSINGLENKISNIHNRTINIQKIRNSNLQELKEVKEVAKRYYEYLQRLDIEILQVTRKLNVETTEKIFEVAFLNKELNNIMNKVMVIKDMEITD